MNPSVSTLPAGGLPLVVALHCSGGSSRQWRKLADRLSGQATMYAPDLYGTPARPLWHGREKFSLAVEAEPVLAAIDNHAGPVHLVGHSYGGGLALHVASRRPGRIASLSLYEPSAFHLLKVLGGEARNALQEILRVANAIRQGLVDGAYASAAADFVDYWNGAGSFEAMRPEQQAEVCAFVWKAALDFHALIEEPTPLSAYCSFDFPVLLARGERAPRPTRIIAGELAGLLPSASLAVVSGAGHMGPLSHGAEVADLFAGAIGIRQQSVFLPRAA